MKIGIIGTRGIPNFYGGFEQFAEFLSVYLVAQNHEVVVYNSSKHPYQETTYKGVTIIHCYDPEDKIGAIGQFMYDYNCILDSRKRNFDVILQLGYTSSSVWSFLFPKKAVLITNMDGLEWKRSKYAAFTKRFLKFAEKLAVKHSDFLISDSKGIKNYLQKEHKASSKFIAYGGELFTNPSSIVLKKYNLLPENYNLLIARIEPENNIETILDGAVLSADKKKTIVVGDFQKNTYSKNLVKKYTKNINIQFIGSIYNLSVLNNLRYYANLYFHGHSVGGTNPSLIEAMSCGCLIVAHKNEFNEAVLEEDAFYFKNKEEVAKVITTLNKNDYVSKIEHNLEKIKKYYNINHINNLYTLFFDECLAVSKE